jgi:hypothetical protein
MKFNADQRRALELLAAASPRGIPEDLMINAHMFELNVLVGLIRERLAVVATEKMMAGQRAISVARLRITDAGRLALAKGV